MDWIKFDKNNLPPTLENLLVTNGKHVFFGEFLRDFDNDYFFHTEDGERDDITYWMPLPNPPQGK